MPEHKTVLGIDISLRCPGFAFMREHLLVESHILPEKKVKGKLASIGERLLTIQHHLRDRYEDEPHPIIWKPVMVPDYVAIEKINVGRTSFDVAKKMAYVEGVVYMFAQENDYPLFEISAKSARADVLGKGKGNLKKHEVGELVRTIYGESLTLDETDAIVVALAAQLHTGIITKSPFQK